MTEENKPYIRLDEETELMLLEPKYAEMLFVLVERNREYLREWLPWVDKIRSVEDERKFLEGELTKFEKGEGFVLGIWHQKELVGTIGLHYIKQEDRCTEIGYWLSAEFGGRGIMTRACRELMAYIFDALKLHRVEIRCSPENERSRAIPRRLGFIHEGTLKEISLLNGHYTDLEVYRMLEQEWRNKL